MQLSKNTLNIMDGVKYGMIKNSRESANHVTRYLMQAYSGMSKQTQATVDIYNSMYNLHNANITLKQLCEWVELNRSTRVKNKKDYEYIINTIVNIA